MDGHQKQFQLLDEAQTLYFLQGTDKVLRDAIPPQILRIPEILASKTAVLLLAAGPNLPRLTAFQAFFQKQQVSTVWHLCEVKHLRCVFAYNYIATTF